LRLLHDDNGAAQAGESLLTTLGIVLGVAIFFAIQITNTTLVASLHETIEKLAGKASLQLTAGDAGFSERLSADCSFDSRC
jgi:hypothetical protein